VNIGEEGDAGIPTWHDPGVSRFHSTDADRTDGADPTEASEMSGSSTSPTKRPSATPSSSKRNPRKRIRDESPKESTTDMLLRMLMEDRAENKRVRQEDREMMKSWMSNIMPQVCAGIARDIFVNMHAANPTPMQMIAPSLGQSQQLLIGSQPHASVDCQRQPLQLSGNPSTAGTSTDQSPAVNTSESAAQHTNEDESLVDTKEIPNQVEKSREGCSQSPPRLPINSIRVDQYRFRLSLTVCN